MGQLFSLISYVNRQKLYHFSSTANNSEKIGCFIKLEFRALPRFGAFNLETCALKGSFLCLSSLKVRRRYVEYIRERDLNKITTKTFENR